MSISYSCTELPLASNYFHQTDSHYLCQCLLEARILEYSPFQLSSSFHSGIKDNMEMSMYKWIYFHYQLPSTLLIQIYSQNTTVRTNIHTNKEYLTLLYTILLSYFSSLKGSAQQVQEITFKLHQIHKLGNLATGLAFEMYVCTRYKLEIAAASILEMLDAENHKQIG